LTFHVTGFRWSIGGGIGYWIGRISGGDCGTSILGIEKFEEEFELFKDWDVGIGRRFFWVLFEDNKFNVTDGGDNERFIFGIRERLDSKLINFEDIFIINNFKKNL